MRRQAGDLARGGGELLTRLRELAAHLGAVDGKLGTLGALERLLLTLTDLLLAFLLTLTGLLLASFLLTLEHQLTLAPSSVGSVGLRGDRQPAA